jgi:hypothetical protein
MNTRLFCGALIGLLFPVVGCAVSTVLDEDTAAFDAEDESDDYATDQGSDDPLDGIGPDDSLSVERDAGKKPVDAGRTTTSDGGNDAGGASVVDAGKPVVVDAGKPVVVDSGTPGQTVDAGKPAVVDAGKPAVVDAGSTPLTIPLPDGCTAKTLSGHRYAFCTSALSFNDARSACIKAGMDLTLVGDRAESDFVAGNGESWIGETYVSAKSAYLAVVVGNPQRLDGPAISYVNWAQGDSNATKRCGLIPLLIGCHVALSSETCVRIASGGWDDAACSSSKRYVCESY